MHTYNTIRTHTIVTVTRSQNLKNKPVLPVSVVYIGSRAESTRYMLIILLITSQTTTATTTATPRLSCVCVRMCVYFMMMTAIGCLIVIIDIVSESGLSSRAAQNVTHTIIVIIITIILIFVSSSCKSKISCRRFEVSAHKIRPVFLI